MSEPNQWDSKTTPAGRALEAMKYGVDLPPPEATESREECGEEVGHSTQAGLVGAKEARRLMRGGRLLARLDKALEGCANREDVMSVDADLLLDLRTLIDDELTELERQLAGLYEPVPGQKPAPPAEHPAGHPNIICLCGSSRFVAVMAVLAWQLEKRGNIVLSLHLLPSWYTTKADHQAEHEGVAEFMDDLHLRKIDLADEVIVVDVDGYIGESTVREIQYARGTQTPSRYLSEEADLLNLAAKPIPQGEG